MNKFIDESFIAVSGIPIEWDDQPVKACFLNQPVGLLVEELSYEEYTKVVAAIKAASDHAV